MARKNDLILEMDVWGGGGAAAGEYKRGTSLYY